MDDLLSLMVEDEGEETKSGSSNRVSNHLHRQTQIRYEHNPNQTQPCLEAIVQKCPYSNYTIIKRETSTEEIANILEVSNSAFIPLPRLSTMSQQLLETQRETSPIATIGIVKSASGSKLSKTGNAYAILEIASIYRSSGHNNNHNIECLPMISLFLFGKAYSAFNIKMKVADIILILDPISLPVGNSGGDKSKTLQSFKLYEDTQLKRIGVSNDLLALSKNRSQRNTSVSKEKKAKPSTATSKLQQLKETHNQISNMSNNMFRIANNNFYHPPAFNGMRVGAIALSDSTRSLLPLSQQQQKRVTDTRKLSSNKVEIHESATINTRRTNIAEIKENVFLKRPSQVKINAKDEAGRPPTSTAWLFSKTKATKTPLSRPLPHQKRKELAASHDGGCDGSVPVPKPNAVLFNRSARPTNLNQVQSTNLGAPINSEVSKAEILASQRRIAVELRAQNTSSCCKLDSHDKAMANKNNPISCAQKMDSKSANVHRTEREKSVDSLLFGNDLGTIDANATLAAVSIFNDEVSAHLYAKSRQSVLELEQKEEFAMKQKQKTIASSTNKIITHYACETCNSLHSKKPNGCIIAGHIVKKRRNLEGESVTASLTTNFKKSLPEQGKKNAELILGQGLEWSGMYYK